VAEEPLTFCTSFLSLRQYVGETYGKEAFKAVREALHRDHDIALPPVIVPGSWMPTRWFTSGMNVAKRLYGPDDFHARFGWAAAEYEVNWVHRAVLRFTSPMFLLERGADVWRKSHSTGNWTIEGGRPRWLRGELRDFGVVDAGYCDSLRTWLTRACMMTGAAKIQIFERRCRARDANAAGCVFEGTW
jgi:hypothetical protein